MAYSDRTYVGTGPGPGPIKFNCYCLSSHISCSVKVKHKIMQTIFSRSRSRSRSGLSPVWMSHKGTYLHLLGGERLVSSDKLCFVCVFRGVDRLVHGDIQYIQYVGRAWDVCVVRVCVTDVEKSVWWTKTDLVVWCPCLGQEGADPMYWPLYLKR